MLLYSKIVLVAIQDEGSKYVPVAMEALKRLGATDPILKDFRGSFCLVGYAGDTKPSWITQQQHNGGEGPSEVSVQIPFPPGTPNYNYSKLVYLAGTKCCRREGGCKECQCRAGLLPYRTQDHR